MREQQIQHHGEPMIASRGEPSRARRWFHALGNRREPERVFGALFVLPALALVVVFRMVQVLVNRRYR